MVQASSNPLTYLSFKSRFVVGTEEILQKGLELRLFYRHVERTEKKDTVPEI